MAVKIRLQRHGRKKAPFYQIVIADARAPRDGKYIERIGTYNPPTKPATIELDRDAAYSWLMKGAQPTDTARAILRFKGVFFRKHLARGVAKGAFTEEVATEKWQEWINAKEAKISKRVEQTQKEKSDLLKAIHGEAKKKPAPAPVEEVEAPATDTVDAPVAETVEAPVAETTEVAEAPVETAAEEVAPEAPATETVAETEVIEEAPVVEETPAVAETENTDTEAAPPAEEESTEG